MVDTAVEDANYRNGLVCRDLTSFGGLVGLGLEATGRFLARDRAVLACRVAMWWPRMDGAASAAVKEPRETR